MRVDVLTLFPPMVSVPLGQSMLGRAQARGLLDLNVVDLRPFGVGRYKQVDDIPYGGGSGMVLRVDVVDAALESVRTPESRVLLMDPAGTPFTQAHARRLSACPHLIVLCGHYEGVDRRVRDHLVDEAISIGDYVLTGGELAALVVIDAVVRLQPGVLGNPDSLAVESFGEGEGLLEGGCWTRPVSHRGWEVPEVLRSGHHAKVAAWRHAEALARTAAVRPDLLPRKPRDGG